MDVQAAPNPVLVEVTRGGIESFHRGACAVVDTAGRLVRGIGNIDELVLPRSAVKPIQALPLLETRAADAFNLTDEELALACASHSGEIGHAERVERWLKKIGLSRDALECGEQFPLNDDAATELILARQAPSTLHNNCSGKHSGFLTTARHLGETPDGYVSVDHPVQRRVAATLSEMAEYDVLQTPVGIDGCGIPVRTLPLSALARAMARFVSPQPGSQARKAACERLFRAMVAHPWLVGGSKRFDTVAMETGQGDFIVKTGAEGVHVAAIPHAGLGIALKIDDGGRRAAEVVMAALLEQFGAVRRDSSRIKAYLARPIKNNRGETIGVLRPAASLGQSA